MKKRALSIALALVIMVGMVPIAGTCLALSDKPTDTASSNSKRASDLSESVIDCYRNAMALYDWDVNRSRGTATTDYIFLDPHEAWDSYIARKYSNNWFTWWVNQMDLYNERLTRPNNLHPEDPEWWAKMDSYLENVAPKEHIVDKTIDWNDFYEVTSFETGVTSLYLLYDPYSYKHSKLSAEDEMWIEWYDVTQDYPQRSAFAQFCDMSFQDWVEMRNTMSDEESDLFHAWWRHASYNTEDETTFEEYKEREGYTEKQPVQPTPAPSEEPAQRGGADLHRGCRAPV